MYGNQRDIGQYIPVITLKAQQVEQVKNQVNLTVDEDMTRNGHVPKIANNISRSLGIVTELKRFLPTHILRTLYNSLILPHLLCFAGHIMQVDYYKLRKGAVRIITCSKYHSHSESILKILNLLNITDILKLKALKSHFNYSHDNLPPMFTPISDRLTHDMRQKSMFRQLPTQTKTARHRIRHHVPESFNKTEPCITI